MTSTTHTPNSPSTISRARAKSWTLGAQLASGVFVLGAVALGVIGLPDPGAGATINPAGTHTGTLPGLQTGTDKAPADDTHSSIQIDTLGLAQRFALLDNAPKISTPPDTDVSNETGEKTDAPTDTGEIAKRVRYIGFINEPDARHAFIRIDGKQRIVSLGEVAKAGAPEFSDLTIERITPTNIVMTDGTKRAQIMLASRTGQSITMVEGGKIDVAKAAENGSVLTAEDEAAIMALPPRQQPSARRRLERERRGLSPVKESRRPIPKPLGTARGSLSRNRNNRND